MQAIIKSSNKKTNLSKKDAVLQKIFVGEKTLKRKSNVNHFDFNKKFMLAFPSCGISYTKTDMSDVTNVEIVTFIHSLPLDKLFFYLTEGEYRFIKEAFQISTVESVTVKIHNMGVSSTERDRNQKVGIWRGFEKYAPTKFGKNLTPKELYGSVITKLPQTESFTTIPSVHVGAIAEFKPVENRIVYEIKNFKHENEKNNLEINLPPLMGMAAVQTRANESLGLLYRTTYKPKYGMIHCNSSSKKFYRSRKEKMGNAEEEARDGYFDRDSYEKARIEERSGGSAVAGLGVGLFPTRSAEETDHDVSIELCVETHIRIKVEHFS